MKATRQSITSSAARSRQPRAVALSGASALNRRVGNARLQRSLDAQILQRSPNYNTNCEALDQKSCKWQSCGHGGSGKCSWLGPVRKCKCVGSLQPPVPPPVRVPEPERKPLRFRVRSHPDFGEYADRLPYMEALPGRELIVVMEAGLFAQALAIAGQRRVQNLNRMRQVDPRNAPFIQVQPVLIGGAVVAAAVSVVALGYILGPALAVLIEAAAAATAGVSAAAMTAVGGALEAAAGWGFGTVTTAAAAGIIAYLVAGGMSEAQAAAAVKPLIGKRLLAVADTAAHPELINTRPGQAVDIDGQAFNAILQLWTPA
ncbi:MAG TPA: hypothetical protein VK955_05890 [Xanthobacteraceae bacterium]|nr:hypothetical protein [Xanthobacteraceae bacterium]